ncbi:hypothetical protein D3C71_1494750 [compost metagenome]
MAPVCSPIQLARASSAVAWPWCAAALPSSTALRSPPSSERAMARLASEASAAPWGAATFFSWAMAEAMEPRACTHWLAFCSSWCLMGMAQSPTEESTTLSWAPWRTAWRTRRANSGWSLRRLEPTTSTRCSVDREAMDVPSQRMPSGAANSALRRR